jgi:hypothetical protein
VVPVTWPSGPMVQAGTRATCRRKFGDIARPSRRHLPRQQRQRRCPMTPGRTLEVSASLIKRPRGKADPLAGCRKGLWGCHPEERSRATFVPQTLRFVHRNVEKPQGQKPDLALLPRRSRGLAPSDDDASDSIDFNGVQTSFSLELSRNLSRAPELPSQMWLTESRVVTLRGPEGALWALNIQNPPRGS